MKNPAEVKLLGAHLRKLRVEKGYSQQELADIANVAKITVQRIENAKFAATIDILISLSEALQVPLRELVDFPIKKGNAN